MKKALLIVVVVFTFITYEQKKANGTINMSPDQNSKNLDQTKANDKKLMAQFDITSIDVVGYPDYLNYKMEDQKVVQSWWNLNMERKSDSKKIVMPILFINIFNDQD